MRYLSEEWIAAAATAVAESAGSAPAGRVVVDQIIEDAVSYRITIAKDVASLRILADDAGAEDADARFMQTLSTAVAIAQGATDAHQAFLLGHVRFSGDVEVLIARRDSFTWLEATLRPVLEATTF